MGFVVGRWKLGSFTAFVLLAAACGQTDGRASHLPPEPTADPMHPTDPIVVPTPMGGSSSTGGSSTVPVEQPIDPHPVTPQQPAAPDEINPTQLPACNQQQPTTLTDDADAGCNLAFDDERIYYSSSEGIMAIAKNGGEPVRIGGANAPVQISLDSTTVYWSGRTFSSAPKSGGQQSLLRYATTNGVAATESGVYFATWDLPTVIERWSSGGKIEPVLDMQHQAFLPHLVVDDAYVYVVQLQTEGKNPILRASLADGKTEQLTLADLTRGFSVDSGYLYFTEEPSRSLKRVPVAGGDTQTVASFGAYPVAVAAHGDQVYVTLETLHFDTHSYTGQVIRLATDGSHPCQLAQGADYGPALTVDDNAAYWVAEHQLLSIER